MEIIQRFNPLPNLAPEEAAVQKGGGKFGEGERRRSDFLPPRKLGCAGPATFKNQGKIMRRQLAFTPSPSPNRALAPHQGYIWQQQKYNLQPASLSQAGTRQAYLRALRGQGRGTIQTDGGKDGQVATISASQHRCWVWCLESPAQAAAVRAQFRGRQLAVCPRRDASMGTSETKGPPGESSFHHKHSWTILKGSPENEPVFPVPLGWPFRHPRDPADSPARDSRRHRLSPAKHVKLLDQTSTQKKRRNGPIFSKTKTRDLTFEARMLSPTAVSYILKGEGRWLPASIIWPPGPCLQDSPSFTHCSELAPLWVS